MSKVTRKEMQAAAAWRRCCVCGRFIAMKDFDEGKVQQHDPTSVGDFEPREPLNMHKACYAKDAQ